MSKSLLKQLGLSVVAPATESETVTVTPVVNTPDDEVLKIAEQAHEANRAYCAEQGDTSQVAWAEASQAIRDSAIRGVQAIKDGKVFNSKDSHDRWMEGKIAEGWTLGAVKDEAAKTHPSLVPYDQLPEGERAKDDIFVNTVKNALGMGEQVSEAEVETVAAECMALMRSMETLEVIADTLESAPVEQMNETNAALINTVVQGVVGQDEGERMMPSAESYGMGSKRILAAYAKEGVLDKIKEGCKAIIKKIVEFLESIWNWITNTSKKSKEKSDKAEKEFKSNNSVADVQINTSESFGYLMKKDTFSVADATENLKALESADKAVSAFLVATFSAVFATQEPGSGMIKVPHEDHLFKVALNAFSGFHNGIIYDNIKCRRLTLSEKGPRLFQSENLDIWAMPDTITVNREICSNLLKSRGNVAYNESQLLKRIKEVKKALEDLSAGPVSGDSAADTNMKTLLTHFFGILNEILNHIIIPAKRTYDAVTNIVAAFNSTRKISEQAF